MRYEADKGAKARKESRFLRYGFVFQKVKWQEIYIIWYQISTGRQFVLLFGLRSTQTNFGLGRIFQDCVKPLPALPDSSMYRKKYVRPTYLKIWKWRFDRWRGNTVLKKFLSQDWHKVLLLGVTRSHSIYTGALSSKIRYFSMTRLWLMRSPWKTDRRF